VIFSVYIKIAQLYGIMSPRKTYVQVCISAIKRYQDTTVFGLRSLWVTGGHYSGSTGICRANNAYISFASDKGISLLSLLYSLLETRGRLSSCLAEDLYAWGEWNETYNDNLTIDSNTIVDRPHSDIDAWLKVVGHKMITPLCNTSQLVTCY
jgi:hypothetical protein